MKLKKSLFVDNYYYLIHNYSDTNTVNAEFSDNGDIKICIFFSDAHFYPLCYELLYKKYGIVWEPVYNNGRLL